MELAAAAKEAEVLLSQITASTTIAEKEKAKVAVIVSSVTSKAQVGITFDGMSDTAF